MSRTTRKGYHMRTPDVNGYYECDNYEVCNNLVDEYRWSEAEMQADDTNVLCERCGSEYAAEMRMEMEKDHRDWYYGRFE